MAHHIKQLLSRILPQEASWKRFLRENWSDIMGKLHAHVTIEGIFEDMVVVGVQDSCWLQELYMLSPLLLRQINEKLDLPRIKQVRFKQVGRKKKETRLLSENGQLAQKKVVTQYGHQNTQHVLLSSIEQQALGRVADPDLKAALVSYLVRCNQEKS